MPQSLTQWSVVTVAAFVVALVIAGIVPFPRNWFFRGIIGTVIEAAMSKTKIAERQARLLEERHERVRKAADTLANALTMYANLLAQQYARQGQQESTAAEISVALGILTREGPDNIQPTIQEIRKHLSSGIRFSTEWTSNRLSDINSKVREWIAAGH